MQLFVPVAYLDANNQPSPDDPERKPREDKRPDFQWAICDHHADPDYSRRTFVVECKRLREPSPKGWRFNINYVEDGAKRFTIDTHLYGKDDLSGGMVGYVQYMEVGVIWGEVNHRLAAAGLPSVPMPQLHQGSSVIHASEHELSRMGGQSPFRLHHLWVDLRR